MLQNDHASNTASSQHARRHDYLESIDAVVYRPVLLLCDHAGREIPAHYDHLGIDAEARGLHVAWDIGAADVTRAFARLLGCHAILNHVSRLLIDCNRRPYSSDSMPRISDGITIPGNARVSKDEADLRTKRYFLPYHRMISKMIAAHVRAGRIPLIVAIHSFTPHMAGQARPWHIGVLRRGDDRVAGPILHRLRGLGRLMIGDNQPYSGFRAFGYTINFHAQRPHFPHIMFELRQDEIDTPKKAETYAQILADALQPLIDDPSIYRKYRGDNLAESGGLVSWRRASILSP